MMELRPLYPNRRYWSRKNAWVCMSAVVNDYTIKNSAVKITLDVRMYNITGPIIRGTNIKSVDEFNRFLLKHDLRVCAE